MRTVKHKGKGNHTMCTRTFRRGGLLIVSVLLAAPALAYAADLKARSVIRRFVDENGAATGELKDQAKLENATAIGYRILVAEKDGTEKPVPDDHVFRVGQLFRLEIEAANDLYIYVLHEGADGTSTVLMPHERDKGRIPFVKKGEKKILPDDGSYFEFVPPAGTERLRVYATPQKKSELEFKKDLEQDIQLKTAMDKASEEAKNAPKPRVGSDLSKLAEGLDPTEPQLKARGQKFQLEDEETGDTVVIQGSFDAEKKLPLYHDIVLKVQ